ncbi:hypothetical protein BDZ94DRAFT_1257381 [Collybia nuda]|uniref:Piwi domain-containing protein n=1 Tax=Collybia nuda TaxID=64659 RepID=A0A9P5YA93_9AGAR|nr:hypothetical protein BDZ94DRAFT_1257381 [Collybia nuda]
MKAVFDENKFFSDTIQSLSFGLFHVSATSTRSIAIPAPVRYEPRSGGPCAIIRGDETSSADADMVHARVNTYVRALMTNVTAGDESDDNADIQSAGLTSEIGLSNLQQVSRMYFRKS